MDETRVRVVSNYQARRSTFISSRLTPGVRDDVSHDDGTRIRDADGGRYRVTRVVVVAGGKR